MTFRAKLLLAIVGVVVATTAASLAIAQRQNAASYRALVDELFRNETAAFQREQETRHEVAAEDVARLAGSVRLYAALEAGDPEVYKIARDELRLGEFTFFRLLDAHGAMIPAPLDARAGDIELDGANVALVPRELATNDRRVQLGFVASTTNAARVYRLLAAPVVNFDARVGTLLLGQRLHMTPNGEARGLRSALWIDGRLVGGDLPAEIVGPLAVRFAQMDAPSDAEIDAGGVAYRYQRFRLNPDSAYPATDLVSIFSMASFAAEQRALAVRIAATGAIALIVASALGVLLARQLARPVALLVAGTREIGSGRFEHRLPRSPTREFDALAAAFNDMAAGLAQKERYRSVLAQVTDADVAEALIAGRVKLGGEAREVTVMFCDIRDYTPFAVGRAPEAVVEVLNAHHDAMSRIVHRHRGVINQFAGDSIMALFGAPQSYGNDAERALGCASEMMRERERLNAGATHPIRIGIGIASGNMIAGRIGTESRSDYTVVGERVNLAARFCAAAAAGDIVVDAETAQRAQRAFVFEALAPLSLKGFAEPVPALRLVGAAAAASA